MTYKQPKSTNTEPGIITLAGDLAGTATSPAVVSITGSSGNVNITASQTVINSSATENVVSIVDGYVTTNAVSGVAASYTLASNSVSKMVVSIAGIDTASDGYIYTADYTFTAYRTGSGSATLLPASPVANNVQSNSSGSSVATSITASGNAVNVNITSPNTVTMHYCVTLSIVNSS